MTALAPFVSVIIPTHNREEILPTTLGALAQQTYEASRMEIVVVADGCVDGTKLFVEQYHAPFPVRLVEQPGSGPSTARNAGAAAAQGEILIFIDDDIEAVPGFVACHVNSHASTGESVVIGSLPLVDKPSYTFFDEAVRKWWRDRFTEMSAADYRFRYGDFFSGNFSMTRSLFERLEGFNTNLWTHEDYDLGMRAAQAGAQFRFSLEACGIHHDVTDAQRALTRRTGEGKADVYLAQEYPQLKLNLPLSTPDLSPLSKLYRYFAFHPGWVGSWLITVSLFALNLFETVSLRLPWQLLFFHLQDYYYWVGVASVATPQEVRALFSDLHEQHALNESENTLYVNVNHGVELLERRLERERPESVQLYMDYYWVGAVEPVFGAEKVKMAHVRRAMTQHHLGDAFEGLTMNHMPIVNQKRFVGSAKVRRGESTPNDAVYDYYRTPKAIGELDVVDGIPNIEVPDGHDLHLLVKYGGVPLGWLEFQVQNNVVTAGHIKNGIKNNYVWNAMSEVWQQHLPKTAVFPHQPPITVIVCTRDRTDQLEDCIRALLNQTYKNYSILIVDNAPSDNQSAVLVQAWSKRSHRPIQYVREARPGLDWARNRGILEAKSELIAFTDDDARPDRRWLEAIVEGFAEPEVTAVTGPALPGELETVHQNLFEFAYGGMSHGFARRLIRGKTLSNRELLWASSFGVGANMAFRKSVFEKVGLFDVALDVGTPTTGGGDIEMLHRVAANGFTILYEPTSFVWHMHRRTQTDLEKHMQNNGRGFGAYLLTSGLNGTVSWFSIIRFWFRHWLFEWILKRLLQPNDMPKRFILLELQGGLKSIPALIKSKIALNRAIKQTAFENYKAMELNSNS